MPYIWGVGLVYFGLNDSIMLMIAWCMLFVVFKWFFVTIKEYAQFITPLVDIIMGLAAGKRYNDEVPDLWVEAVEHMIKEKDRIY